MRLTPWRLKMVIEKFIQVFQLLDFLIFSWGDRLMFHLRERQAWWAPSVYLGAFDRWFDVWSFHPYARFGHEIIHLPSDQGRIIIGRRFLLHEFIIKLKFIWIRKTPVIKLGTWKLWVQLHCSELLVHNLLLQSSLLARGLLLIGARIMTTAKESSRKRSWCCGRFYTLVQSRLRINTVVISSCLWLGLTIYGS